jgi:hypothetical protein
VSLCGPCVARAPGLAEWGEARLESWGAQSAQNQNCGLDTAAGGPLKRSAVKPDELSDSNQKARNRQRQPPAGVRSADDGASCSYVRLACPCSCACDHFLPQDDSRPMPGHLSFSFASSPTEHSQHVSRPHCSARPAPEFGCALLCGDWLSADARVLLCFQNVRQGPQLHVSRPICCVRTPKPPSPCGPPAATHMVDDATQEALPQAIDARRRMRDRRCVCRSAATSAFRAISRARSHCGRSRSPARHVPQARYRMGGRAAARWWRQPMVRENSWMRDHPSGPGAALGEGPGAHHLQTTKVTNKPASPFPPPAALA